MDTRDVATLILSDGGFTGWAYQGTIRSYDTTDISEDVAWCVAINPPHDPFMNVVPKNTKTHCLPTQDDIRSALWDFLRNHYVDGQTFGAWYNEEDGCLYIDYVHVWTQEYATNLGTERGELAIYNLVSGATVNLSRPVDAA